MAGVSHPGGGTGLLISRTPVTMPHGDVDSAIFIQYDTYKDPVTGKEQSDFRLTPSLSRALTERFEAGLSMPYLSNNSLNANGLQNIGGYFNWRFLGERRGAAASLSGYLSVFSASALTGVGSGYDMGGGAVNVGYMGGSSSVYLSLGRGQVDRPLFTFSPAVSRSWVRLYETSAALGYEYHADGAKGTYAVELVNRQDDDAQQTLTLTPSMRYQRNRFVTFSVGATLDLSEDDQPYQPESQVYAGVSFNTNATAARKMVVVVEAKSPGEAAQDTTPPKSDETVVAAPLTPAPPAPPAPKVYQAEAVNRVVDVPVRVPRGVVAAVPSAAVRPVATAAGKGVQAVAKPVTVAATPLAAAANVGCYNADDFHSRCGLQVEVLNQSGRLSAGNKVAEQLRAAGYNVVRVDSDSGTTSPVSWVRYRPGLSGDGVKVGHVLPGNQVVSKEPALPKDVAVRVVVGSDMQ